MSTSSSPFTLPERVAEHAHAAPSRIALRYLRDGEDDCLDLDYVTLHTRAQALATELERRGLRGQPVLLLYPAGPDYLCALLACFASGAIAVPAYPPSTRLGRANQRIQAIVSDSRARVALTTRSVVRAAQHVPALAALTWLATDALQLDRASHTPIALDPDRPCLLQYTSGSLGQPKGVLITQRQLLANLTMMSDMFGAGSGSPLTGPIVTWLPPYHDMGLIGTLLSGLYEGLTVVQLSPEAFARRPVRWLRAITRHRGALTVVPNFALELCARRVTREQRVGLDLSSLAVLITGSEPVRPGTLARFAASFGPHGLSPTTLCPCYGMAEAVLLIAGARRGSRLVTRSFAAEALEAGHARIATGSERTRTLVSCGAPSAPTELCVVDPVRRRRLLDGSVGELWIRGPALASGYFERANETQQSFGARLDGDATGSQWLRSGDLGFIDRGELFVVGRIKETIVVRGLKHHPHDLESRAQQADPRLHGDAAAAFAIERDDGERVCLVQEVHTRETLGFEVLIAAIRTALQREHGLAVDTVVLVRRGSIPKTSSGKIVRGAVKQAFLDGSLMCLARSDAPTPQTHERELVAYSTGTHVVHGPRRALAIERFLQHHLAAHAGLPEAAIDRQARFADFGIDSLAISELAERLSHWLARPVPASLLYDHARVDELARALAELPVEQRARTSPPSAASIAQPSIAVIGMACRFPGASDLDALWRLLSEGRNVRCERPRSRPVPPNCPRRPGGFLDRIEDFDAAFFHITPREAARMDPQQRLFLEVVWHALEDAGIPASALAGTHAGVFAGVCGSEHAFLHGADPDRIDADFGLGHSASIVANRVSYFLDLNGPSTAFDSACASSLVALHAACQSLRSGESSVAIAGGVNAVLAPHSEQFLHNAGLLSADGRCRSFDVAADGFGRADGCGVLVLKRLDDARAAGDRIYACIEGSAIAHSGASHGLTAPNGRAQAQVIRRALDAARVNASALDVIEAHGVGAPTSDRVELRALHTVLGESPREAPCWVASVKTNLGHLEAAAGVASVIKIALALHHESIPRHVQLEQPVEELAQAAGLLAVPHETVAWRRSQRPRYAGVSAFGLGGSLAHVVLRESPLTAATRSRPGREPPPPSAAKRARSYTEPGFGTPMLEPAREPPLRAVHAADETLARDDERFPPARHEPRPDTVTMVRHVWLARTDSTDPSTSTLARAPAELLVLSAKSDAALVELARRYAEQLSRASLDGICASAQLERTQLPLRASFVAADGAGMVHALRAFADAPRRSATSTTGRAPRVAVHFGPGACAANTAHELCELLPTFRVAFERAAAWLSELLPLPLMAAASSFWNGLALLFAQQYALFEQLERWGLAPFAVIGSDHTDCLAAAAAGAIDWRSGLRLALLRAQLMASLAPGATVTRSLRQVRLEASLLHYQPTRCALLLASCDEPIPSGARVPPDHMQAQLLREPRADAHPAVTGLAYDCVIELGGPAAHGGKSLHVTDYAQLLRALGALFELGLDIDFSTLNAASRRSPLPLPSYPFQHPEPPPEPTFSHAPAEHSSHPLLRHMTRTLPEPEPRKRKRTG